jgi:hypothetical protein
MGRLRAVLGFEVAVTGLFWLDVVTAGIILAVIALTRASNHLVMLALGVTEVALVINAMRMLEMVQ